jgi:aminopeptidase-like protein/aminoglycoside N3'-acetyltransferase
MMMTEITDMVTSAVGNYSREDLVEAFHKVGLRPGDTVFTHFCLDTLGQAENCTDDEQGYELVLSALQEVVSTEGTILVPTYTFSFCRQELFDIQNTPTAGGPWSTSAGFLEYFRKLPGVVRSGDPIHSVAGLGPRANELLSDLAHTCFGAGSVFDRLHAIGGKICTIGVGLHEATFQHHVEEMIGVPFRFKKLFTGYVRDHGVERKEGWIYNVRILADNSYPDNSRVERKARELGICRAAEVGYGQVLAVDSREHFALIADLLSSDPWYTAKGPAADPVALEQARVNGPRYVVELPENASMGQMVDAIWQLPRDIVSQAYDDALEALATQVPMTIHNYPTGTESWSWIVPEKWTCYEAYLETMDGQRLFSYADHPLHVVSYSLPFDGIVSRAQLFAHLHTHPILPDAIPFIFKYYERDWGLCCSKNLKDSLHDEQYRVVIKTDFSYSTLKVGEVVVPGASDETIVLCVHLCHPGMVNDDLTGVVVGIDVMRELLKRQDLRYTYKLLIVPETIGSVAYLSHHEDLIPKMKGGLFLEMLGLDYPHALQSSFQGDTELDQCFELALHKHDYQGWVGEFRTVIGNDERQFNAPGVRVPMLSLSRVLPPQSPDWPYPEYHSSHDTPAVAPVRRLEDSRDLVLAMIDTLERNLVPLNKFKGEAFCSRFGIHIDAYANPEGNKKLFDIMFLIDGTLSIAQIANKCSASFEAVRQTIDVLVKHGLVEYLS